MHEHGIADKLLKTAQIMADEQGLKKITRISIGLGALSGLSEESLIDPLEHAAEEMGLGGVSFVIAEIPPLARCRQCGMEIGENYTCPYCGSTDVEVMVGTEAAIMEIA